MIRALGIQSVSSPSIRWPSTSNGLQVSGPSLLRSQASGRSDRRARRTGGVRRSRPIASSRSKFIESSLQGSAAAAGGRSEPAANPLPIRPVGVADPTLEVGLLAQNHELLDEEHQSGEQDDGPEGAEPEADPEVEERQAQVKRVPGEPERALGDEGWGRA